MSRNDAGDRLCPGCGRPMPTTRAKRPCTCTLADVVELLEADRAELSRRAAEHTGRMNGAVGLVRRSAIYANALADTDAGAATVAAEIEAWLLSVARGPPRR